MVGLQNQNIVHYVKKVYKHNNNNMNLFFIFLDFV